MDRKNFETAILNAMYDRGVTGNGYKINITNVAAGASDWATVTVDVIRPRCRKPCITWELVIWVPGMILYWDKSKFYDR